MAQPDVTIQPAEKRTRNFNEVSLGYPKKIAGEEANRCPQCADALCNVGCPLDIDIPGFIRLLREGSLAQAFDKIKEDNPLPSICGRICPAPCERSCIFEKEKASIGIRALERHVADAKRGSIAKQKSPFLKGKKIAIVGSGPAGLSAAYFLAKQAYQVTVFDSLDEPGGVLRYGIPEFRLPRKVLDDEIADIQSFGVEFQMNCFVGQTLTVDELFEKEFAVVLLAMGAGIPKMMEMPGTNLGGVYYGEEFLMRASSLKSPQEKLNFFLGKNVAVIGSGNTALDCARTAVRLGRSVKIFFRNAQEDFRARQDEQRLAKEEHIKFEPLTVPLEILADQNSYVGGLKCVRMDYAQVETEEEHQEQWELKPVPGSEFVCDVDTVIIAVGHQPNVIGQVVGNNMEVDQDGSLVVDVNSGMTTRDKIFAAGNVVTNAGSVVEAIAAGKESAQQIDRYLKGL